MNNDIKEIKDTINYLKSYVNEKLLTYTKIDKHDRAIKTLLDYITNLQELCDKYEEEHKTTYEIWKKDIGLYNSVVDRIDKAIEYLEQKPVIMINGEPREIYVEDDNKLLNILNGDDKK